MTEVDDLVRETLQRIRTLRGEGAPVRRDDLGFNARDWDYFQRVFPPGTTPSVSTAADLQRWLDAADRLVKYRRQLGVDGSGLVKAWTRLYAQASAGDSAGDSAGESAGESAVVVVPGRGKPTLLIPQDGQQVRVVLGNYLAPRPPVGRWAKIAGVFGLQVHAADIPTLAQFFQAQGAGWTPVAEALLQIRPRLVASAPVAVRAERTDTGGHHSGLKWTFQPTGLVFEDTMHGPSLLRWANLPPEMKNRVGGSQEYKIAVASHDLPVALAHFRAQGASETANAVEAHIRSWQAAKPPTDEGAIQRVQLLWRRIRHQIAPEVLAGLSSGEDAFPEVLREAVTYLDSLDTGVLSGDVGPFGAWKLASADYGGGARHNLLLRLGTRWTKPFMAAWGSRLRFNREADGSLWISDVPVRSAPQVARRLEEIGNFALAMSLRIGLLTDALAEVDQAVDVLASAPSIESLQAGAPAVYAQAKSLLQGMTLPLGLTAFPYQLVGAVYAHTAQGRVMIGDAMGLGKTIQAILFLRIVPKEKVPALIVTPASVAGSWLAECGKWVPEVPVDMYEGGPFVPYGIQVCTYDSMRQNAAEIRSGMADAGGLRTLIFDESHYLKNAGAQRAKSAFDLAQEVPNVLLLSGTPMPNRLEELWHQFYILAPGIFPAFKEFKQRFAWKVEAKGGHYRARRKWQNAKGQTFEESWDAPTWVSSEAEAEDMLRMRILEEMRDTMRGWMIRRLKADVIDQIPPIPPKTRKVHWVHLPEDGRRAYIEAENRVFDLAAQNALRRAVNVGAKTYLAARADVLARLNPAMFLADIGAEVPPLRAWIAQRQGVLRQALEQLVEEEALALGLAAGENALTDPDALQITLVALTNLLSVVGMLKASGGVELARNLLKTGEPVVIFCDHLAVVQTLENALGQEGYRVGLIAGDTPVRTRAAHVLAFQRGELDVIIGTRAMREGVTLTRAAHAIFVERWWVPAWEAQAEDRIYRIGQTRPSTIHRLMLQDTVDLTVAEAVEAKAEIIQAVLREDQVAAAKDVEVTAEANALAVVTESLRDWIQAGIAATAQYRVTPALIQEQALALQR